MLGYLVRTRRIIGLLRVIVFGLKQRLWNGFRYRLDILFIRVATGVYAFG